MDKRYLVIAGPETAKEPDRAIEKPVRPAGKLPWKTLVSLAIYLAVIPALILIGVKLLADSKYNLVSIAIAFLACVPFFLSFERDKTGARELVVVAVMTAISVLGRLIFAAVPGFKPVTAIVIITAVAYGPQAGFLTGSMSAIVSNIFFMQGPWTPFQMFAWGILGWLAGWIFPRGKRPNAVLLSLVGLIGGVLFSLIMDVWSVLNLDGAWNWARYWAALISGAPFMAVYAASNVVFLLLLTDPFLKKLNRVKDKYGLFPNAKERRSYAGAGEINQNNKENIR